MTSKGRSSGLISVLMLTVALHQCFADHGCEPKKMTEIKHSLRRSASAYTNYAKDEFRIKLVFTDNFKKVPDFNTVVSEYVEPGFSFWKKVMKPKVPTAGPLKVARSCISKYFYWVTENGIQQKYCDGQCLPEAKCFSYVVPKEYMDDCRNKTGRNEDIIRDGGPGVMDTDFLVFVDYKQDECGGTTMAFASCCQQSAESDRPEVAYINYCPHIVKFIPENKESINKTTIHELGHALGFSSSLFAYFRDENGAPRTPRDANGNTPRLGFIEGDYAADKSVLEIEQKQWLTANGKQNKTIYVLKTETLMEVARKYFRCDTLAGVELENNEGKSHVGSHFEKAMFMDEVMMATTGKGYVSAFTLAFMRDTGWYHVDMSAAEHLPWGYKKGCKFTNRNCAAYMESQLRKGLPITPWCDEVQLSCKPGGYFCNLRQMTTVLPEDVTYFKQIKNVPTSETNKYAGTDKYTDYCPYLQKC